MDIGHLLFSDPVVMISMIGLFIVLGICGFYVYFILKNVNEAEK